MNPNETQVIWYHEIWDTPEMLEEPQMNRTDETQRLRIVLSDELN